MMNSITSNTLLSFSTPIGELLLQNNKPLLKMWNVSINSGSRKTVNHSHSRFEITVCESGSGVYSTNKSTCEILPGDVFVFASNEQHCITQSGFEGLKMTNLHFEPRYLSSDGHNIAETSLMSFCFYHSPSFENRIACKDSVFLRESLAKIKEEFSHNDNNQSIAIKSYLNLMLIDLLRNHKYQAEDLLNNKKSFASMLTVYEYIDTHLNQELKLDTLAAIAGFSPNYFSHVFKKLNGISLWDYIVSKRIEKAIKMLLSASSSFTMLDIALECGFNNTANFNKAFKKHKGVTPSEYRNNLEFHFH